MLLEQAQLPLTSHVEELGRSLGEELLEPTRIYTKDCLELISECEIHTFCHVTGGGLAGNLSRVIPEGLTARLSRATWKPLPVFRYIQSVGKIARSEMEKTFNMGVGMVAVLPAAEKERALAILAARHIDAWELGMVEESAGSERVVLEDEYAE